MKKQQLQTLKGFRDFLPEEKRKRDFVVEKIKKVFELYGFQPIETPALEYSSLLLGKYGDEADKLIYSFEDRGKRKVSLKYDQTIPTARIIAQYQDIPKPFKRYQIQPVWRSEKPQRGRYREFVQCDADIYGPKSYTADAEILTVFGKCFDSLGIDYKIRINSREILFSLLIGAGISDDLKLPTLRVLDKLDKKSEEEVREELSEIGLSTDQIDGVFFGTRNRDISEDSWLKYVIQIATTNFDLDKNRIEFAPTMVRGLDYYTGLIFEAVGVDKSIGSLGGGGRYDNLIGELSGGFKTDAVGFALGFDRIVEVLNKSVPTTTKVFVTTIREADDENGINPSSFNLVTQLRRKGVSSELNLDKDASLQKQLSYASKRKIPNVLIVGPDEASKNVVKLKDMVKETEETLTIEEVISRLI